MGGSPPKPPPQPAIPGPSAAEVAQAAADARRNAAAATGLGGNVLTEEDEREVPIGNLGQTVLGG